MANFLSQAEIDSLLCCVVDFPCYVYLKSLKSYKVIELNYQTLKQLGINLEITDNEINDDVLIPLLDKIGLQLLLIEPTIQIMVQKMYSRVNNIDDSDFGLPNRILDKNDMDYCNKILEQYPEYII